MNPTVIAAIFGFIGVLLGGLITLWISKQSLKAQAENLKDYFDHQKLNDIREERKKLYAGYSNVILHCLEFFLNNGSNGPSELNNIRIELDSMDNGMYILMASNNIAKLINSFLREAAKLLNATDISDDALKMFYENCHTTINAMRKDLNVSD